MCDLCEDGYIWYEGTGAPDDPSDWILCKCQRGKVEVEDVECPF